MKHLLILALLSSILLFQTASARTVEVDVYGMTCAFCVDSLERKFGKMESVSNVQVSLKTKKIRLETDDNHPSIETIEQTILDAGFTPTKITVLADEKYQK
jgi:copper ion binding protein